MRSMIQAPRRTGDVVVPLAVTLRTLGLGHEAAANGVFRGRSTWRISTPVHAGDVVVRRQAFVEEREVGIDDVAGRRSRLIMSAKKSWVSSTAAR